MHCRSAGICIRSIADLLGYFTHFESGIRTDAVIKNNAGEAVANIEWEWKQPFREDVNEIQKLYETRETADVSVFIGYCQDIRQKENIERIRQTWSCKDKSLIVFLVTFRGSKPRVFDNLDTYIFKGKTQRRIRSQPALPWMVKGTRWEQKTN